MIYISDSFSLAMLDREQQRKDCAKGRAGGFPRIPYPVDEPKAWIRDRVRTFGMPESIAVHDGMAAVLSSKLEIELRRNPGLVRLADSDVLLVGQYFGVPWPEGVTIMPKGGRIEWWGV